MAHSEGSAAKEAESLSRSSWSDFFSEDLRWERK